MTEGCLPVKRKKPPQSWPPEGFGRPASPPPSWAEAEEVSLPPAPGDPAPAYGSGLTFRSPDQIQREAWEARHMAWLDANHLAYTREELRAWYDNPARDRIPMPGVVE